MATGIRMSLAEFEVETRREPYRQYEMAAWLERDIPPKDYLLGHWLHTTARCLLSGDTGIGKSMFGLELAFCVARGLPFLHWPAGRSCRAIYLDSEMGPEEVKERLRHLSERHGGPTDNLTVLALEDFPGAASLDTDEGQAWILSIVETVGAEFVVFDNLMTLVTGVNRRGNGTPDRRAKGTPLARGGGLSGVVHGKALRAVRSALMRDGAARAGGGLWTHLGKPAAWSGEQRD